METTNLTVYDACAIIEGFAGFEPSLKQTLEAWAYLIKTGQCWSLQGFYGRNAASLIEQGVISDQGVIDWTVVEQNV